MRAISAIRARRLGLVLVAADVGDDADRAFRLARHADIAAVQDQPVMRVQLEALRRHLLEEVRDLVGGRARARGRCGWRRGKYACRRRSPARRRRCSAPRSRSSGRRPAASPAPRARAAPRRRAPRPEFATARITFFAFMLKKPSERIASTQLRLAEGEHLLRRVDLGEERPRRPVHAGIGRLRREHDGDEQRIGVDDIRARPSAPGIFASQAA